MRLEDLKDPRDREACERAERAEAVRQTLHRPTQEIDELKNPLDRMKYDQQTEDEFQKGL